MCKNYKQNKDIIFRQEGDEAIMFNPGNSDVVVINSTGCFIWSMCNGRNTRDNIIAKMAEEFDVSEEKACKDLVNFISGLEKRNFIEKLK